MRSTLAELRGSPYWVSQAIKKLLISCARWKRFITRLVLQPNVASLPVSRIEFEIPFRNLVVDFTGNLWVMNHGKENVLLLFTCIRFRVVHIEGIPDMSVLSFFQALVRFINPFGIPEALYSDNVETFLGSGRLFGRLSLLQEYQDNFGVCNIKLNTITLFLHGSGGTLERSVQTLKTCLYKVIGRG